MNKKKLFKCYKKYILNELKKRYVSKKYKKYTHAYYLKHILYVLDSVVNWKSLNLIFKHKHSKNHYKSIANEYRKWCKDGIFENAFYNFLSENYFKMSKITTNKKINMFIDVTKINNICGSENVGLNCEYKKKFITALQIICDQNGIPISVNCLKQNIKQSDKINPIVKNNKIKNKIDNNIITNDTNVANIAIKNTMKNFINNVKKKISITQLNKCINDCIKIKKNKIKNKPKYIPKIIRKTLEHEIMGVQDTLNNIPFKLKKYVKVNLIGDKAYTTNKSFDVFDRKIKIISPTKSNQKILNTSKEKLLLSDRFVIENFFINIKRKNRINVRKDRKIINFMGFVYIALLQYLFDYKRKNNC